MGFKEIEGNYVESSFWNMDVLFIPQDHPAREMQDTLYCKNPIKINIKDNNLLDNISKREFCLFLTLSLGLLKKNSFKFAMGKVRIIIP